MAGVTSHILRTKVRRREATNMTRAQPATPTGSASPWVSPASAVQRKMASSSIAVNTRRVHILIQAPSQERVEKEKDTTIHIPVRGRAKARDTTAPARRAKAKATTIHIPVLVRARDTTAPARRAKAKATTIARRAKERATTLRPARAGSTIQ